MKKCIMVFFAHPDDVEWYAGGTFAKCLEDGFRGCYVVATNGNSGYHPAAGDDLFDDSEKMVEIRRQELRAAAAVFGVEPIQMNFKEHLYTTADGRRLYADIRPLSFHGPAPTGREPVVVAPAIPACVREVEKLMLEYEPEIVITHEPDGNPDHYCTLLLAYNAFVAASRKVRLGKFYLADAPDSWFAVGLGLKPDLHVDITRTIEKKLAALAKHVSQGMDTRLGRIRQRCRAAGQEIGVEYAERFVTVQVPT